MYVSMQICIYVCVCIYIYPSTTLKGRATTLDRTVTIGI